MHAGGSPSAFMRGPAYYVFSKWQGGRCCRLFVGTGVLAKAGRLCLGDGRIDSVEPLRKANLP